MKYLYFISLLTLSCMLFGGCNPSVPSNEPGVEKSKPAISEQDTTDEDKSKPIVPEQNASEKERLSIETIEKEYSDFYCGTYREDNGQEVLVVKKGADSSKVKTLKASGYKIEYGQYLMKELEEEKAKITDETFKTLGLSIVFVDGKTNRLQIGFENRDKADIQALSKIINLDMATIINEDVSTDNSVLKLEKTNKANDSSNQ